MGVRGGFSRQGGGEDNNGSNNAAIADNYADDSFVGVGDWDSANVLNGNPNAPSDISISDKKANDISAGMHNPHYDNRHGAYTTLQQQYERAMYGTNPQTGKPGKPVNASKFFNSADMEYALSEAERLYNPIAYDKQNGITIDFDRPVGDGFVGATDRNKMLGIAGEYRWSNSVTVKIDLETGKAYTAYPNLDKGYKQDNDMLKFIK